MDLTEKQQEVVRIAVGVAGVSIGGTRAIRKITDRGEALTFGQAISGIVQDGLSNIESMLTDEEWLDLYVALGIPQEIIDQVRALSPAPQSTHDGLGEML